MELYGLFVKTRTVCLAGFHSQGTIPPKWRQFSGPPSPLPIPCDQPGEILFGHPRDTDLIWGRLSRYQAADVKEEPNEVTSVTMQRTAWSTEYVLLFQKNLDEDTLHFGLFCL